MAMRTIRIGSGKVCDLRIDDTEVADLHASMYLDGDKICLDLLPECPAMLNGNEVTGRYWLNENDVVVIGAKRLNLRNIKLMFEGQLSHSNDDKAFFTDGSFGDQPDAVVVKQNWWPAAIVTLVVLAASTFVGFRFVKYHRLKTTREQELRLKQDSLMQGQQRMDSLANAIKQLGAE